jgi:Tol biopolymer transport system component
MNPTPQPETLLHSWKEIGPYLQRDATTARRWEKEEGLPVHRHTHKTRSSVYAYPSEIDAWRESRKALPEPPPPLPFWNSLIAPPRRLAFGLTMALCLVSVGNGLRPQAMSAQEISRRLLWAGKPADSPWAVSRDGKTFVFDTNEGSDFKLRDIATGAERKVTVHLPGDKGGPDVPVFSRDGSMMAYTWWGDSANEIRIANAIGESNPRTLLKSTEFADLEVFDWSPDGKRLIVTTHGPDKTLGYDNVQRLGLLTVADSTLTNLQILGDDEPDAVSFSIDGTYLTYDQAAASTDQRDVFLLPATGGTPTKISTSGYNTSPRWSPDGKRVVYLKDRGGNLDIWSVSVESGRAGTPQRLLANNGEYVVMGLSPAGTLFYEDHTPDVPAIKVAAVDFKTGRISEAQGVTGAGANFTWSAKGHGLVFASTTYHGKRYDSRIVLRDLDAQQTRILKQAFGFVNYVTASPDGRTLAVTGMVPKLGFGIYLLNVENGGISKPPDRNLRMGPVEWSPDSRKVYLHANVGTGENRFALEERDLARNTARELARVPELAALRLSPDGKRLYFRRTKVDGNNVAFVALDLATGKETELIRRPQLGGLFLSPDGRSIVTGTSGTSILLIETATKSVRELLHANGAEALSVGMWAPDSSSVFLRTGIGPQATMLRMPLNGGPRQDLGANMLGSGGARVSPDGRYLAFQEEVPPREGQIWALENFLNGK